MLRTLTRLPFKMAFSSRVRVYHAWQNADAELRQIQQAHERNRAQGRIAPDRLGHSYSQIGDVRPSVSALAVVVSLIGHCADVRRNDARWRQSRNSSTCHGW